MTDEQIAEHFKTNGIKVYHMKLGNEGFPNPKTLNFPEDFQKVAVVDTEELEEAWMLTNTIESLWTENANVIAVRRDLRSSMVGDVMVIAKTGQIFQVAGIGFEERKDWFAQKLDELKQSQYQIGDV